MNSIRDRLARWSGFLAAKPQIETKGKLLPDMQIVAVDWVDSARPVAEWRYLSDAPELAAVVCRSVGWIVGENEQILMLAPNLGDIGGESEQGCGFIRIPKVSITRRASLQDMGDPL